MLRLFRSNPVVWNDDSGVLWEMVKDEGTWGMQATIPKTDKRRGASYSPGKKIWGSDL